MINFSEQRPRDVTTPAPRVQSGGVRRSRRGPVVLAIDGTNPRAAVVVIARQLAARLDVSLEVVSVLQPSFRYLPGPDVVGSIDPDAEDIRREERETVISDYVARFSGGAAPARVHVRVGGIVAEVTRFAREVSATMIVMGSSPHRRFGRIGSAARAPEMLHSALCPVLSVPPTFSDLPRRVVVGVDFGPSSVRAAQAALAIVQDGGRVVLTHVQSPQEATETKRGKPIGSADRVDQMFERLCNELSPYKPAGVLVETRVVTGEAVHGIIGSADDLDADLIAVGTHGQGLLERFLLGSVADRVLRQARRPVLASPPPLFP